MKRFFFRGVACGGYLLVALSSSSPAAIVINEFLFDDGGTDDFEYVELYNSGPNPVEIGDWVITGHDAVPSTNPSVTITPGTILAPGSYYVVGNAAVPNTGIAGLGQVVPTNTFENDTETLELYNGAGGSLIDAVLYESSPGTGFVGAIPTYGAQILTEIGTGYWGNHTATHPDNVGTPFTSLARWTDGRDTNNNGRDFGLRRPTPGANNQISGTMSGYTPPNVDAFADGDVLTGHVGSFVNARVITPGSVNPSLNLNPIPPPNHGLTKAIIAWDHAGGGNAVVTDAVFSNGGSFNIQVYLDTENIPFSTATNGTPFTTSEITFYGIGSIDNSCNLEDLTGAISLGGAISVNGATGIHWLYEKTSNNSERLILLDANDGGNSNTGAGPVDWTILQVIDLSFTASGWHDLGLSIAPDGTGLATFDGQSFGFTTIPDLQGSFVVGYRENAQDGTVTTVPSYLRPATFAMTIPEPTTTTFLALGALCFTRRRRA